MGSGWAESNIPDEQDKIEKKEQYFRFFHLASYDLEAIGRMIILDKIAGDSIYAYAGPEALASFVKAYGTVDTLLHPSLQETVQMAEGTAFKSTLAWNVYPTYQAYETLMLSYQQQYPDICSLHVLGTLPSGRRILALRITDHPDSTEAEPGFLYTSSMHGDELVGYVLMLRLADYLLSNYGSDARITRMVDSIDIWINPLANPDGAYRIGNHTVNGATRSNANWVDLNRNFPDPQDGPHPDGKPWQPETNIFMGFAAQQKLNMSCNIHGGAEVCNYPWDTWSRLPADDDWWDYVCNQYADTAQFHSPAGYMTFLGGVTNGYAWYSINGGRQDYMNYFHHCREFTLELSNTKLPSASSLPAFWNYNYRSLLNYLEHSLNGLHGMVTDSLTGEGVQAKVFIQGHDVDSSFVYAALPHGDYYRYLPTGTYDLTFSAPGYVSKTISTLSLIMGQGQTLDVQLRPDRLRLSGVLQYHNAASSLMAGALIRALNPVGAVIDSAFTDSSAQFTLWLPDTGTYTIEVEPATPWGGVNSADALRIAEHFAQLGYPLTGLPLAASDVNNSGFVNATDALRVQRRFVGIDTAFDIPDWLWQPLELNISADTVIVLQAIAGGDANQSFSP
jgi:hypothetical protein